MWDFIQIKFGNGRLRAPIVNIQEVDGFLNIVYDNPAFYFKGTINLSLASGLTRSSGIFEVTVDEPSNIYRMLLTGHVERQPGLLYFVGTCCDPDEPSQPSEIIIQYMPLHELTDEPDAPKTAPQD